MSSAQPAAWSRWKTSLNNWSASLRMNSISRSVPWFRWLREPSCWMVRLTSAILKLSTRSSCRAMKALRRLPVLLWRNWAESLKAVRCLNTRAGAIPCCTWRATASPASRWKTRGRPPPWRAPADAMLRYISTRLLYMVPVLWLVVSVVFLLIHLVPGDPIQQMLGEGASSADIQATRHAFGLDVPIGQQYLNYWKGVLHGDLGRSMRFDQPVAKMILARYPWTLQLTLAAIFVAMLISFPAGVRSARRRNRWDDRTLSFVSLLGLSFPNFALGPILILLFAIKFGWLPVSGAGGPAHLVLPAITMGGALAAILTRMVRTAMLEELSQDYIRTARAKGLSENVVVYRHALRNAMIPVLTVIGLQFGALLAGAIVTETIFSWPGIGRLTIQAISNRDYSLVQGCILAIGLTYVAANFLTDLLYSAVNPRIRQ